MIHFGGTALLLFFLGTGLAQQTQPLIDRKWLKESISPGETLIVTNRCGDVHLRHSESSTEFEVFTILQNSDPTTAPPLTTVERKEKIVHVSTQCPESRDRADLVIYVPPKVFCQVTTSQGTIEARNLQSSISAHSEKGDISIRTVVGSVSATNVHGSIQVHFSGNPTDEPQRFSTLTGNITLYFPEEMNTKIRASTSGEITTDYTVEIQYDKTREPDKTASAILGKGTSEVVVESKRGNIRLLRRLTSLPKALPPPGGGREDP